MYDIIPHEQLREHTLSYTTSRKQMSAKSCEIPWGVITALPFNPRKNEKVTQWIKGRMEEGVEKFLVPVPQEGWQIVALSLAEVPLTESYILADIAARRNGS